MAITIHATTNHIHPYRPRSMVRSRVPAGVGADNGNLARVPSRNKGERAYRLPPQMFMRPPTLDEGRPARG